MLVCCIWGHQITNSNKQNKQKRECSCHWVLLKSYFSFFPSTSLFWFFPPWGVKHTMQRDKVKCSWEEEETLIALRESQSTLSLSCLWCYDYTPHFSLCCLVTDTHWFSAQVYNTLLIQRCTSAHTFYIYSKHISLHTCTASGFISFSRVTAPPA